MYVCTISVEILMRCDLHKPSISTVSSLNVKQIENDAVDLR